MPAPIPTGPTLTLGTAGAATPVTVNLTSDTGQWDWTYVTLTENYVQANPPGFLCGTPGMLNGTPNSNRGSYANGQRAVFWKVEALALVAAGAGILS